MRLCKIGKREAKVDHFVSLRRIVAVVTPTAALGRRLPLAIPMNERLPIDVAYPKPTVPRPARSSHQIALSMAAWTRAFLARVQAAIDSND